MRRPAEWALFAVMLATIAGFGRLFEPGWFWPLAIVALYSSVAVALTRDRGWSLSASALATGAGLLPVLTTTYFFEHSLAGLPTLETRDAASQAFDDAWKLFSTVVAPAPPATGFLLATSLAVFVAVFLADWAAFRLWSPFEALVPGATLFVFAAMLGTGERVAAAALWGAAAILFLLLHRTERMQSGSWVGDPDGGRASLVRQGAWIGIIALAVGTLGAPLLPGADEPGLVKWRASERQNGSRVTISPLVDIQKRLIDQSEVEMFTVRAGEPAYWRLTSLDTFDGQIWRSGGKYKSADEQLPEGAPSSASRRELQQRFSITNLSALWLPAAYEPRRLESRRDVRYQADSGTLIVDTDDQSSDGFTYAVTSALPVYSPAELLDAPPPSAEMRERYTRLPSGFSQVAQLEAQSRALGDTTYEKMLALQTWFRTEFTYSLEVPAGHGESAIDEFLSSRSGYCEQFAGTFAAMAMSLGIPARVAVGFMAGEERDGTWHVTGKDAHAWPEVWFEGLGWVPFEPTPGRGQPGAREWTGLDPVNTPAEAAEIDGDTTTSFELPSTTSATAPGPDLGQLDSNLDTSQNGAVSEEPAGDESIPLSLRVALLVPLLLLTYAAAVALLLSTMRRRRQAAADEPDSRVLLAWDESLEALAALGSVRLASETYSEYAARAGDRLPAFGDDLEVLADAATTADYWQVDAAVAERATAAAEAIESRVNDRLGHRRWLRMIDLRRAWAPPRDQSSRRKRSRMR